MRPAYNCFRCGKVSRTKQAKAAFKYNACSKCFRLARTKSHAAKRRGHDISIETYLKTKGTLKLYKRKHSKNYYYLRSFYQRVIAMPKWVDLNEIVAVYDSRPKGHHVDHIIPINGPNVCGLHVPWNLQYLKPKDNIAKGNKHG